MKTYAPRTTLAILMLIAALGLANPTAVRADDPVTPPVFSNSLTIDNPYMPIVPNRIKIHVSQQGNFEEVVLEVHSSETRTFTLSDGITQVECALVSEIEFEDGELVEISMNYFAQADDKTVYYFGETVDNYEDGVVVAHGGSWLVGGPQGSDPAETATATDPAVFMPGHPEEGDVFKPEDLFPLVDESDLIVKVEKTVVTPAAQFKDVIKVMESTMLSDEIEYKWYGPGIGVLKAATPSEIVNLADWVDTDSAEERDALVMELIEEIMGEAEEE